MVYLMHGDRRVQITLKEEKHKKIKNISLYKQVPKITSTA